ncbi:PREDICTED: uncharacterized protein LOC107066660 [Polistes dominula]|uniref:Uncharacterized protein LOC107066660 n=1 Tax=Polistes dominula TaxID=743375 RepID=A0ABM1I9U3_POLDO|nr:PREDICTED: uncharacterized protein LOC107066660 [Polistes dominula]
MQASQIEAVDDATRNLRLMVNDRRTGACFLIDTGADVSVIPRTSINETKDDTCKLYAANGAEIDTFGKKLLNLNLGLRRDFSWRFIIANVSKAIIGADFLHFYNLLPDLRNKKLLDGNTLLSRKAELGVRRFN